MIFKRLFTLMIGAGFALLLGMISSGAMAQEGTPYQVETEEAQSFLIENKQQIDSLLASAQYLFDEEGPLGPLLEVLVGEESVLRKFLDFVTLGHGEFLDAVDPAAWIEYVRLLLDVMTFQWQTTSDGITRLSPGVLNVPTPLDVDGIPGPDVIATLGITPDLGIQISVESIDNIVVSLPFIGPVIQQTGLASPLRIEAIVKNPLEDDSSFAVGYDSGTSLPPLHFSEKVNFGLAADKTDIIFNFSQVNAAEQLTLIAEEFSGTALGRSPNMRLGINLAGPVPSSLTATLSTYNGEDKMTMGLASSDRAIATIDMSLFSDTNEEQPTHVVINRLPANLAVDIGGQNGDTSVNYVASHVIENVYALAENLSGIGSANVVEGTLSAIPTRMDIGVHGNAGFDFAMPNEPLGQVEFGMSNGDIDYLDAALDGVLAKTTPEREMVSGRLSGLKQLSATLDPVDFYLNTVEDRPLRIEISEQGESGAAAQTLVTMSSLPNEVRLGMEASPNGDTRMHYEASRATENLNVDILGAAGDTLQVDIAPLPASIDLCMSQSASCTRSGRPANTISLLIETSEEMTVNMRQCTNAGCNGGGKVHIRDLSLQYVDFAVNLGAAAENGSLFFNTNRHRFSGHIYVKADPAELFLDFGPNFWTYNRDVRWYHLWIPVHKTGEISGAEGSSFGVRLSGFFWVNLWIYFF